MNLEEKKVSMMSEEVETENIQEAGTENPKEMGK